MFYTLVKLCAQASQGGLSNRQFNQLFREATGMRVGFLRGDLWSATNNLAIAWSEVRFDVEAGNDTQETWKLFQNAYKNLRRVVAELEN